MRGKMDPEYYESIVLVTIDRLLKDGRTCGQLTLVDEARLGNVTIIKAIDRLEAKGRLRVIRGRPGQRYQYEILDPPTGLDFVTTTIHLERKSDDE